MRMSHASSPVAVTLATNPSDFAPLVTTVFFTLSDPLNDPPTTKPSFVVAIEATSTHSFESNGSLQRGLPDPASSATSSAPGSPRTLTSDSGRSPSAPLPDSAMAMSAPPAWLAAIGPAPPISVVDQARLSPA